MAEISGNGKGCGQATPKMMTADLGLFNQLLEMVDGDWSASIQGICRHIHNHFDALGVSLTVYDRTYEEFIYLDYSINPGLPDIARTIGITVNRDTAIEIVKKIHAAFPGILEEKIFTGRELLDILDNYFGGDETKISTVTDRAGLKAVASFPVIETNRRYRCIFHIFTDRDVNDLDRALLDRYMPQLDVALEIVFLVRELYIKATHDGLTRLLNHKQGEMMIASEIERVKRNKMPLSVAMIDLDHFKSVNDTHGHRAGDEVLKKVASILSDGLRKCDIISRFGGEEFLVGFIDTDLSGALEVSRRLKEAVQLQEFCSGRGNFSVTISMGVVEYNMAKHPTIDAVICDADNKLYAAKSGGRNRIEY